ncbi:YcxB family protein [Kitasatospora sp. NPDC059599]|uniref:YcxB family protein n=1 Tax=Kitasatospora sp. NPDC059599 TaxID=3346880 RepID=UPI0036B27B5A
MEQERVELAYAPTAEDFREAFAAQARHTTAGRLVRVLVWVPAVIAALGGVLKAADGEAGVPDALTAAALVALALLAPRYQVFSAQRRAARRGGEYRAVVDATGVSVTDARGTRVLPWTRVPRSLETERLFVVLNSSGNCLLTLPKRGTSSPDALRALIARHTTPVVRAAGGAACDAADQAAHSK